MKRLVTLNEEELTTLMLILRTRSMPGILELEDPIDVKSLNLTKLKQKSFIVEVSQGQYQIDEFVQFVLLSVLEAEYSLECLKVDSYGFQIYHWRLELY